MGLSIEVENLHVAYRAKSGAKVEAVQGLSFTVGRGEVVGFLGPNGAGKSSTLKALMGFVSPTSGSCKVFGLEAGSISAKRRVGYLPEVALYYPFLTPLETLHLYGELQGLSGQLLIEEAKGLLELVGMSHAMTKQNRQLSKGMLQRVGIAQALLGNPELLILDEVTSGLDPVGRRELRNLLRERQKGGATLFFSSHELSEVDMLCDRILVINNGKFVEERNINELKGAIRKYELQYTGAASLIGLAEDWREEAYGVCVAQFEDKERLVEEVARVQASSGRIVDIIAQEGSLEDYFIQTIGRAA